MVTNPLSGLLDGMIQGHQLAMQLHNQAQQDQAFKTNQALHEQQMSMQDIMNRQLLQENARPVSAAGTIDNPAVQGPPSPLSGVAGMPALPNDPGMPAYVRKADATRTVKYGGQQYELKTPDEQRQSKLNETINTQDALELAKGEGVQRVRTSVLKMRGVPLPPDITASLGMPNGTLVLPEEIPQYRAHAQAANKARFEKVGPNEGLFDLGGTAGAAPAAGDDLGLGGGNWNGGSARVAQGPPVTPGAPVLVQDTPDAPASQAAAGPNLPRLVASGVDKAGMDRTSREQIAADRNASANTRATNRNATTLQAAQDRRDNPTPGQAAVEGRFEQRRQDMARKQMNDVQAKEDEVHALRTKLGEDLKDPNLSDVQRTAKMGQMKTTAFQVQAYQSRKASIAGAGAPPKVIQDKIPEGQQATGPDGHTWRKQGGIVYFVQ